MRNFIDIVKGNIEETMITNDTSRLMVKTFDYFKDQVNSFAVVADMDIGEYDILRKDESGHTIFLLRDEQGTISAYYQVTFLENDTVELHHAYVDPAFRGNKLTEKFCWFLQTREGCKILFDNHLSPDAKELVKSLYRSKRFKLYWIKDDVTEPYHPEEEPDHDANGDSLGHMAVDGPTGWRLIAENAKVRMPHFNTDRTKILHETYCLF